ncbi:MAG: PBSX family phage terminase large subunit [Clostridia bacterium]|nr:PBSX family phage terminase large subunit [Clostridia bacterium]
MNDVYTEKQLKLMRAWQKDKLKRLNILDGSVRSGKTWISIVLWMFWVATMPKNKSYMMVARTLTTLKRNCLDLMEGLAGKDNFSYSLAQKQGELFGRKIYLEGANDVRSESKIRGMTLQGVYCDEITLFPQDFFNMLLSRLSEPDAKLIGTTNPDSPKHWLKTEFLDKKKELDLLTMRFLIDDNTFLPKDYIKNIKKEYSGVFYERFIRGRWVNAEGLIYKTFADNQKRYSIKQKDVPSLKYINIGVDFGGNKSQHAFVASGFTERIDVVYALKSRAIPATGTSVEDIISSFKQFADEITKTYGFVDYVYADSAEQAIINEMRNKTDYAICNSIKNEIIDRIRCEDVLFSSRRVFLVENENDDLADGLENARWNEKNVKKDERLDDGTSNVDILDAFEYSFESFIRDLLEG